MMCKQFIFQVLLLVVIICSLLESAAVGGEKDCQKRVIRYVSVLDDAIGEKQAKKLTHIIYHLAVIKKDQSILVDNFENQKLNQMVKNTIKHLASLRKVNPKLKITFSSYFNGTLGEAAKMLSTEKNRVNLVSQIIKTIKKFNFDGYDIGWEILETEDYKMSIKDYSNYIDLVKQIRKTFDEYSKKNKKNKLLLSLGDSTVSGSRKIVYSKLSQYFDFVNVHAISELANLVQEVDEIVKSAHEIINKTDEKVLKKVGFSIIHQHEVNISAFDSNVNDYFCIVNDLKKINLMVPYSLKYLLTHQRHENKLRYNNVLGLLLNIRGTYISSQTTTQQSSTSTSSNSVSSSSSTTTINEYSSSELNTAMESKEKFLDYVSTTFKLITTSKIMEKTLEYVKKMNIGGIGMYTNQFEFGEDIFDLVTPSNLCSSKKIQGVFKCPK